MYSKVMLLKGRAKTLISVNINNKEGTLVASKLSIPNYIPLTTRTDLCNFKVRNVILIKSILFSECGQIT